MILSRVSIFFRLRYSNEEKLLGFPGTDTLVVDVDIAMYLAMKSMRYMSPLMIRTHYIDVFSFAYMIVLYRRDEYRSRRYFDGRANNERDGILYEVYYCTDPRPTLCAPPGDR